MKIQPIILAGGSGTRLWPLSREKYPKQFLKINEENSLFQKTILRVCGSNFFEPIVITNNEYRFIVAQQIKEINQVCHLVLEPCGKNTTAAICLAALHSEKLHKSNTTLLVLSADHYFKSFSEVVEKSLLCENIVKSKSLIIFGIKPSRVETGYGYIKVNKKNNHIHSVDEFIEKPVFNKAREYFESGDYYWNSGVFLFDSQAILEKIKLLANDIYENCTSSYNTSHSDQDFLRINSDIFKNCRSESIDYSIFQKNDNTFMIDIYTGWSDIGSWFSLWDNSKKDKNSNVILGDIYNINTSNSYIYSEDQFVATIGVDNLIIINTKDALLVASNDNSQQVKEVVKYLNENNRVEAISRSIVERPWGRYESIHLRENYQVKHITVDPGQKLSVQMHYHRAEHWVVVKGTAKVLKGNQSKILSANQSIYIDLGEIHSLENPGKIPLEIIEVQSGAYLGEDDIIRFDDIYGRS